MVQLNLSLPNIFAPKEPTVEYRVVVQEHEITETDTNGRAKTVIHRQKKIEYYGPLRNNRPGELTESVRDILLPPPGT